MRMIRLNIQIPADLKAKLDELRRHGTTASGYIRSLLERELTSSKAPRGQKGGHHDHGSPR